MKMNKKLIVGLVLTVLILSIAVVAVSAVLSGEKTSAVLSAIIGGEDYLAENDFNKDGKVDILDAILAVKYDNFKGPKATSITFDDKDYSVEFDPLGLAYTVNLPAGRPRIPLVSATAEDGATVEVVQATIADTETSGVAKILVTSSKGSNTYTVNFVRSTEKNNIVLQYDDRWTFTPDYTLAEGESFTFVSSDASVLTVDEKGVITAVNVSENAVTVKAMVGEEEKDSLTVSKVDKARINLFFVTGQSNAHGCYDFDAANANNITAAEQNAAVIQPAKKGQVYSFDVYPLANQQTGCDPELADKVEVKYDMAEYKRGGFASMLGKTYYEMSGEKVIFLQSAYNGSPIERWIDPDNAEWGSLAEKDVRNHYDHTQAAYVKLMAWFEENADFYEINHRANFWLQGETCMSNVWNYSANNWAAPNNYEKLFSSEDYTDMFLKLNAQMKSDFGIEYNNILLVRAHGSVVSNADGNIKAALNNVRSSQYGMANTYEDIAIVSRLSDWVVPYNAKYIGTAYEPYNGMMGVKNVHYNQIGHNENGRIAATNFFKSIDADTNSNATSVEIINTDGIERLGSDTVFEVQVGKTKRIAAFPLPEYSLEDITWKSSDEAVANITNYGLITVVGEGEATITATAENGAKASIKVKGIARSVNTSVKTLNVGASEYLNAMLPEFSFSDITYTSSNTGVATVNNTGVVVIKSEGEATITLTSVTGAYEIVKVKGVQIEEKDSVHYRWDFNGNLHSSADSNDLTVSELSISNNAQGNYKFENNCLVVPNTTANNLRPEFSMTHPVLIDSNVDWVIEWRAKFYSGSLILGQANSSSNIIYNAYTTDFGNGEKYPIRLVPSEGGSRYVLQGNYNGYNSSDMNTWRLEYSAKNQTMSYYILLEGNWTLVGSSVCAPFSAKFTNVGGRYNADGLVTFRGEMDYLDIKVGPAVIDHTDATYKWDFESGSELKSSADENTLTLNAISAENNASAKFENNSLVSLNTAQQSRPVYDLAEPVVLTKDYDWSIEWKAKFSYGSALLGTKTNSVSKSFLYAAYNTSAAGYEYGLRLVDDYGHSLTLPYADGASSSEIAANAKALNTAMNTWKLEYVSSTNILSLKLYDETAGAWTTIRSINPKDSQFEKVTFESMLGRYNEAGMVNFYGTMEYMEIKTKKAVYEVVYDWEFSDNWESFPISNTLTPGKDSGTFAYDTYYTNARKDELALEKSITLDSNRDWSIEIYMDLTNSDVSFMGTEKCTGEDGVTRNHIYFSPNAYNAVVLKTSGGAEIKVPFATEKSTTKTLALEKNTWKLSYTKSTNTLTIARYDKTNKKWIESNSVNPPAFTMTFTHLFGDFNSKDGAKNNFVNFYGYCYYMTVKFTTDELR